MGLFERYLSLWVGMALIAGLALGQFIPGMFEALAALTISNVNFVVAVLIWAMVYPMMIAVDLGEIKHVAKEPKGLVITLLVNWLIKPFTMAGLGVLFFKGLFAGFIPAEDAEGYIAGLILLGAAPCTAMVFVWSQLTRGDANYTLVQVSVNDAILVFAYAPLVAILLGVTQIPVPWDTLLLSVLLYVVVPLVAGLVTRAILLKSGGADSVTAFTDKIKPLSMMGLILTVVILFGFQAARKIVQQLEALQHEDSPLCCDCSIGISYGRVTYGNVGSKERLDFTVIGRPANVAARLGDYGKKVGHRIVVSSDVAHHEQDRTPLGAVTLHIVKDPVECFEVSADKTADC